MARDAIQNGQLGQIAFATWRFGGSGGDCPEHENLIETQCHGFDMLEINGLTGRLLIEDTVRRFSLHQADSETAEVWEAGYFNDWAREFHRTFDARLDAVLDAFRAGREPPVHARAGKRALELAHAAISSFKQGKKMTTRENAADVSRRSRRRRRMR